jgi:hypothetical protein
MARSTIFWDITPCSPLWVNWRFRGTYHFHLQGKKLSFCFLYNPEFWLVDYSACHLLSRCFLAQLIFRPWIWRRYVPLKRQSTLNGLHSVTSQKMVLFKTQILQRLWSCGMWLHVVWQMGSNFSEKLAASIFRVEEEGGRRFLCNVYMYSYIQKYMVSHPKIP